MWDAFISHAREDRAIAQAVAERLQAAGLVVWFDESTLQVGDSIRRSIERGLMRSRFGVVVLSKAFFNKEWPQNELNALFTLETAGRKMILPVWHQLSAAEVAGYSPMLADRLGVPTDRGLDYVAERLLIAIRSGGQESMPAADRNLWPPTALEFVLRVVSGRDAGTVFPLRYTRLIVGRSNTADIPLSDTWLSRSHFCLLWNEPDRCHVVQDWGHPNQLILNGVAVPRNGERSLKLGDELNIGATTLRYERVSAGD